MKIVVLDGYALNPGDLSWNGLKALGECEIFDRTAPSEVLERSAGADVLLTNKTVLDQSIIPQLPDLKYIGVFAISMVTCENNHCIIPMPGFLQNV